MPYKDADEIKAEIDGANEAVNREVAMAGAAASAAESALVSDTMGNSLFPAFLGGVDFTAKREAAKEARLAAAALRGALPAQKRAVVDGFAKQDKEEASRRSECGNGVFGEAAVVAASKRDAFAKIAKKAAPSEQENYTAKEVAAGILKRAGNEAAAASGKTGVANAIESFDQRLDVQRLARVKKDYMAEFKAQTRQPGKSFAAIAAAGAAAGAADRQRG